MKNSDAFLYFAAQILQGFSGIFWSEKNFSGAENWHFGFGKSQKADFENGPFPLFFAADFKGKQKKFVHFKNHFSKNFPPKISSQILEPTKKILESKYFLGDKNFENFSEINEQKFCSQIKSVQSETEKGNIWVLNLAHRFVGESRDCEVLLAGFWRFLKSGRPHSGGVFWDEDLKFASLSPEIFWRQNGTQIKTFPIKGTSASRQNLQKSKKEIAELRTVSDLLRNDFSQICTNVSLQKSRVLTPNNNFFHAHCEISARLKNPNFSFQDFEKLLPAGSISGAPKKKAVEIIQSTEDFDRKFFTGTFGIRTSAKKSVGAILIRTCFWEKNHWIFPVGAGITFFSDPKKEWQETIQKTADFRAYFF